MGLLSGLEKFGINTNEMNMENLYTSDSKPRQTQESVKKETAAPKEEDFLLDKMINCPVCDKPFPYKAIKNSRLRRLPPDKDLRPRFQYIDALKYEVLSCPYCGYTAMNRYFEHISSVQRKLIRENISAQFQTQKEMELLGTEEKFYDYNTTIERYKLSLYNTIVKKGHTSEIAYTCLKLSWLFRSKCEELQKQGVEDDAESMKVARKEEREFYEQAYEGFCKAMATELYPICGMDQNTMDILLAEMAFRLGKYDVASRYVSTLLVSQTANRHTKDKALELKEEIIAKIRK